MKRILIIVSLMSLTFCFSWILLNYAHESEFNDSSLRFVCIINTSEKNYWGEFRKGIAQADLENHTFTKINSFERFDLAEQKRLLDEAQYYHVDGIITIGQPDNSAITESIQQLISQKIPVVLIDTDSEKSERTAYIGSNNEYAGQLAAENMIQQVSGPVHAVILTSELGNANQNLRIESFKQVIEETGMSSVEAVIESRGERSDLQRTVIEYLKEHPEINAVFCAEGATSQQMGLILENHSFPQIQSAIVFHAFGEVPRLVSSGVLTGMLVQDPYSMGIESISYLTNLKLSNDSLSTEIYTDILFIDSEQASTYVTDESDWTPE